MSKVRVAVLGGGVAALTTAFELTKTAELREKYEVTLYQMGWRLGGKGASGRNREVADRIEEHGLHVWMGFYENAFRVMREAYQELGREPEAPLATWQEAFHRHSYIVLTEPMQGEMRPWTFIFPTNDLEPGSGGELPTPMAYAEMLLQWILERWESEDASRVAHGPLEDVLSKLPSWVSGLLSTLGPDLAGGGAVDHAKGHGTLLSAQPPAPTHALSVVMAHALGLMRRARADESSPFGLIDRAIVYLIEVIMAAAWALLRSRVDTDFEARKLWIEINLVGSVAAGIIADDIPRKGFESIDDLDLREWLKKHGANEITRDSALVRGVYDLAFAYQKGDIRRPDFAAGSATRGMLRMVLTYKGSIFYRMQAGMGDVVATPLYEVLERRGVKFEFFHKVTALRLSEDRSMVGRIELCKQVELKEGRYRPTFDVNGLPCWPSEPDYEQIRHGEELKASGIDLECAWSPRWRDSREVALELGRDFDEVVLGISIAALPDVAADLIAANRDLRRSVEEVKTVQTQAMQLWLSKDTQELGWRFPLAEREGPILGAYYEPIDTWADMSDLIVRERWPYDHSPRSIAYFCGAFPDADPIPPYGDHGFPAHELDRYKRLACDFLGSKMRELWPRAYAGGQFLWELLVDLDDGRGIQRFDAQFFRVNIDPTERYVLSVKGSTRYRLRANQLPFGNLVLSGDWTYNGLNAGCVEAAVMSGMAASKAMCGSPEIIVGGGG